MYSGPYTSPPELARRPWGALFWALWAIYLIPVALMMIINLVVPGSVDAVYAAETPEAYRSRWVLLLAGHSLVLVLMMVWCEHIGIGPFAGRMKSEPSWMVIGMVGGPVLFLAITAITGMAFSGGDPNWHLQDGLDPELFSLTAGGLALYAIAILIAPVLEEVAFRGIGMGYFLAKGLGPSLAVIIPALVWTLTHTQYTPLALIPVFVFGLFLAWLRLESGSIIAPIAAHMAVNGSQIALSTLS